MVRLTTKAIEAELKRLGHDAQLAKGDGYFYFTSGEAANWLDTTVKVPTLSSLTLDEWVVEYEKLKRLNQQLLDGPATKNPASAQAESKLRTKRTTN